MKLVPLLFTYEKLRLSVVKHLANVTQLVSDRDGTEPRSLESSSRLFLLCSLAQRLQYLQVII